MVDCFQSGGTDAQSPSHDYHMEKVRLGGYAYLVDNSRYLVEWDCSLDHLAEEIIRLYYSMGLQNNSAYKQHFSFA